ncbi:MAG: BON domain-containing protein [Bacteroidota bacterium]
MKASAWSISDVEIAEEVSSAFKWNWQIPGKKVKVTVEDGWLTLDGDLSWSYQREAAGKSVTDLVGVKGITNNITINSETHDEVEQHRIERALVSNWSVDDEGIQVLVSGPRVTLNGIVHTFYQFVEAERMAWDGNGIETVCNKLVIEYDD